MLKQFSIILSIYFLGELIQKASGLPVPGNVIGMLLLFFGLSTGIMKLDMIGKISNFLLENLAFFFLPASVSLITCFSLLDGKWTAILAVSIISTIVTLGVTGLTVELVKRSLMRKSANGNYREVEDNKINTVEEVNKINKSNTAKEVNIVNTFKESNIVNTVKEGNTANTVNTFNGGISGLNTKRRIPLRTDQKR